MANSPAVVVTSQPALSVGIFEGVVRVLEGLVPEQAGLSPVQAGLILESPVVLPISGVTLWKDRNKMEEVNSQRSATRNPAAIKMKINEHVKGRRMCDMAQVTEISAGGSGMYPASKGYGQMCKTKISHCIVLINVILVEQKQEGTVHNKGRHGFNFPYI